MSNSFILQVKGLSKYYCRGRNQNALIALDRVSFNLEKGKSVGLVGKNGSGKSTLLKIISGIITPTEGEVLVNGSIISMIELGGGMHPDLTGRENIYIYGALLGIKKSTIEEKIDSIIEFSELEDFIDAPMNTYSSGMSMRLSFSVATCIRPDLLLVDEVLGVGDQRFQQKCLKRITGFTEAGTSLVMVHHHFGLIASYCDKGMLLENGQLKVDDTIRKLAQVYLRNDAPPKTSGKIDVSEDSPVVSGHVEITKVNDERSGSFLLDEPIYIKSTITLKENQGMDIVLGINIFNNDNTMVFPIIIPLKTDADITGGTILTESKLPGNLLNTGSYRINIGIYSTSPAHIMYFLKDDVLQFNINEDLQKREISYLGHMPGIVRPDIKTRVVKKD